MKKVDLSEEIENSLLQIAKEEENYKTAQVSNAHRLLCFVCAHNNNAKRTLARYIEEARI